MPEISISKFITRQCRESYYTFFREFWPVVVQERYIHNWHIEKLCNDLQDIAERVFANQPKNSDFVWNSPPGSTKSLPASVLWLPWIWTRMPSARFLAGSYSERLALSLSRQSRDCVKSDKYKDLFPEIALRDDEDTKAFFMNTSGGWRFATGVGGSVTGMHAHFICIDDPLNPMGALSDLVLNEANIWINEALADRKIDKMVVPTVMIMQRLHQIDPTGYWIEMGKKFKHRCLPGDDTYPVLPVEWKDKYIDGLLDPVRIPRALLDEKFQSGESYYAGQYGQQPVPRGGAMFKTDLLNFDSHPPQKWKRGPVRYWDKAISLNKKAAWTVGTKMALDFDDRVWILDVVRGRWNSGDRETRLLSTAKHDSKMVRIGMEQEPAASGQESVENSIKRLAMAGYRAVADKVTGDKIARADTLSVQVNLGNVVLVLGPWNKDFIEEMRYFPNSRFKDQIDSASGAYAMIEKRRLRIGAI